MDTGVHHGVGWCQAKGLIEERPLDKVDSELGAAVAHFITIARYSCLIIRSSRINLLGLLTYHASSLRMLLRCRFLGVVSFTRPYNQLSMLRCSSLYTDAAIAFEVRRPGRAIADGVLIPNIVRNRYGDAIHILKGMRKISDAAGFR